MSELIICCLLSFATGAIVSSILWNVVLQKMMIEIYRELKMYYERNTYIFNICSCSVCSNTHKRGREIMTLSQYLKTIPKNQIIYISGGSGWFYIGTPADYNKHKKQIEKEMHESIKNYSKATKYYISYLTNKNTNKLECNQYIKWWKKLEMKKKALKLWKETLENWVPIDKRRVIRAYRKAIDDDGIGIKIEGPLHGKYWMRSEWEAEHGKIQV